jgi:nitrite reductase/ring-hydroxylating ferredoxin subunit
VSIELRFEAIMPLADLHAGRMHSCVLGGRDILICHTPHGLFAIDNVCTHAYARLSEGRLRGTRVICPLHGACFDVRNGRALGAPAEEGLAVHAVRVSGGIIEVAIDA